MELDDYAGKKVGVIGYGVEGESATKYFQKHGATVSVLDQNEAVKERVPEGLELIIGENLAAFFPQFDLLVRSPSYRPDNIPEGYEVTSVTKEFMARCPAQVIGVTGTKGKGTTTSMIAELLRASGKKVHLLGNIGTPALDVLDEIEPDDVVCYEMSSFQLWDLQQSPHIGVVLMMDIDHLDVHSNEQEYVEAKHAICSFQTESDVVVYHPTNRVSEAIAQLSPGKKIKYANESGAHVVDGEIVIAGQTICAVDEVPLVGKHNIENACAAITAAWQVSQDAVNFKRAIQHFKGLPHRLQVVAKAENITFIDDSISTIPATAEAALRAFDGTDLALLVGGSDKGSDYTSLVETITELKPKAVITMGKTGESIHDMLAEKGSTKISAAKDMHQAVEQAVSALDSGGIVLLSPGSASFDQYKNYKHRGTVFAEEAKKYEQ